MARRAAALLLGLGLLLCQGLCFAWSIAWMSDTQNYVNSSSNKQLYFEMTDWIARSRRAEDIRFVFHTGDVVSASRDEEQWQIAADAMSTLVKANMPYLAVTGNHDTGAPEKYTNFLDYIASQQVANFDLDYGPTGSRYVLFSAGGRNYIFMGISYGNRGPSQEEIDWANAALEKHSDRTAILLAHSYIKRSGEYTTQGRVISREIVEPNPNMLLVLCGHARGVAYRTDELDGDGDGTAERTVYSILSNYQDESRGGDGYMRILRFREDEIYIYTYSPVLDTFEFKGRETDVTTIPLP